MAIHSSIPWTEEPGGLQSIASQRVRHDCSNLAHIHLRCSVTQLSPPLCSSMDCSPPGSSDHAIFQARTLGQCTMPSSRGSSWSRDWTHVSRISCIGKQVFSTCTTWEDPDVVLNSPRKTKGEFMRIYEPRYPFSHSIVSDSLRPHELWHVRPPYPSPTPRVHPNPCPQSRWCYPIISSSVILFSSCPQSFPTSWSF